MSIKEKYDAVKLEKYIRKKLGKSYALTKLDFLTLLNISTGLRPRVGLKSLDTTIHSVSIWLNLTFQLLQKTTVEFWGYVENRTLLEVNLVKF